MPSDELPPTGSVWLEQGDSIPYRFNGYDLDGAAWFELPATHGIPAGSRLGAEAAHAFFANATRIDQEQSND